MSLLSVILICFSLSLDNGAVALASGCAAKFKNKQILAVCAAFVLAHIIMFFTGWYFGQEAGRFINNYGRWAAAALLIFLGAKMLKESFGKKNACDAAGLTHIKRLTAIAAATSLDALAVGASLNMLAARLWASVFFMCLFVFVTTFFGLKLGCKLGEKFGGRMEILGGLVLIAIGLKILLDVIK